MKIGPLTKESIDYVFEHMWHRWVEEVEAFGETTGQAKQRYLELIDKPFAATFRDDDLIPFALAAAVVNPHTARWGIYFVGVKEGFLRNKAELGTFSTHFSDDLVKHGVVLEIFTPFGHGGTHEWILALGFRPESAQGAITQYVKRQGD